MKRIVGIFLASGNQIFIVYFGLSSVGLKLSADVSAVLAQAAHIEGKGFGSIDMTGLAQKGGAVACHMRVAGSGHSKAMAA
jgi:indolepyruvate ferredoxin oxidoreductase